VRQKRREPPYWIAAVEEVCAACGTPHAAAVSGRCSGCDRVVCHICIVTREGLVYCSECESGEGE
jgi:hypothetical protein